MRQFLVGAALAWAIASVFPKIETGIGSGSDEQGDYNYSFIKIRSARFGLQIDYWPEKVNQ